VIRRYNRLTRWFHTGTYLLTFLLLFTGWWLWRGQEGAPSILARWSDLSDVEIHRRAGWALTGLVTAGVVAGIRATITFVRESLRAERGDGRWFLRWPRAAVTGRFAPHGGHFDPGQRLANLGFVGSLGTLLGTGIALMQLRGGPTFAWVARAHRYAFYVLVVLVAGHVAVAVGILPGYRGVWRSMHLRGRVPRETVRRLGPATAGAEPQAAEPEAVGLGPAASGRRSGVSG
jgi:formate dehydrogenase subunit gamma